MPGARKHNQPNPREAARRLAADSCCPQELAVALIAYADGQGELDPELRAQAASLASSHYPALTPSFSTITPVRETATKMQIRRPVTKKPAAQHKPSAQKRELAYCRIARRDGLYVASIEAIPEVEATGTSATKALAEISRRLECLAKLTDYCR